MGENVGERHAPRAIAQSVNAEAGCAFPGMSVGWINVWPHVPTKMGHGDVLKWSFLFFEIRESCYEFLLWRNESNLPFAILRNGIQIPVLEKKGD